MAKVVIDRAGVKRYFDNDGRNHRDDGPAAIYPSGTKAWRRNGVLHSDDGLVTFYAMGLWISITDRGSKYDYATGLKELMVRGDVVWPEL